jgi:hypothetical protein
MPEASCHLFVVAAADSHELDTVGDDAERVRAGLAESIEQVAAGLDCADLHYRHAVVDVEGFQHAGHQAGHGRGTGGHSQRLPTKPGTSCAASPSRSTYPRSDGGSAENTVT